MKFYTNNSYKQMHACFTSTTNHICPEKLYLDITEDCNLYCRMCRDELCIQGKTMDIELFKRVVDETTPYVKSYSLFNWGEPLFVNDFKQRVLYINEHKKSDTILDISTNGMLLSDDMIQFLCDENVIVTVSFDGAHKETFERIRCGSNFERICSNIERLAKSYKGEASFHAPGIYVSIQKDNVNQLLILVKRKLNLMNLS
jgi:MoaA/NifB/PqqE/SkfB family radical SAM enzyme